MSQMIDFTVPSTVPGRSLHAFRCVPDGEVKAILQLSHGMVEFLPSGAFWSPATTIWVMAAPSAPGTITAILPSRTATARCWPTCTP